MSVIVTQGLTRRYGANVALDHADLTVEPGAIFGFLGPNGAGKTTLIRMLLGFLKPSDGRASVFGRDCWRESAQIKREVGSIAGDFRIYPWMTLRTGLATVSKVRGTDLTNAGNELGERFGLDANVRARNMSRGMRQKLGLIMCLASDPKLLILDEPTSGLDPLMQDLLAEILRERARDGATVFFSSHTLAEVEALCDRVAIVRRGVIVADESLESMRSRAHRVVTLTFDGACPPEQAPEGLRIVRNDDRNNAWHGEWDGPAEGLLAWAAAKGVRDMTISPPDLETIFRAHYEDEGGES